MRKQNYKRAYHCLKILANEFPDEEGIVQDIVEFCTHEWDRPDLARHWLMKLVKLRSHWLDYVFLSEIEAEYGNISRAKDHLRKAKQLEKKQPRESADRDRTPAEILSNAEKMIQYHERWKRFEKEEKEPAITPTVRVKPVNPSKVTTSKRTKTATPKTKTEPSQKEKKPTIPTYTIPIKFKLPAQKTLNTFLSAPVSRLREVQLLIDYTHLTILGGFGELLCLNTIQGVDRYWYQVETVRKVLRDFRGRVLLCDEVGLGKTIEAGMLIKEYLLRGMVKNILILTPPSLVSQWKEEMETKFGIEFLTTDDIEFKKNPDRFWKHEFIIASLGTARSKRNRPLVTKEFYDIVVVDEAHHLRNKRTVAWKLVNEIKKKYIFLLSATPVQNNLMELYNLITLLKPGQFKTEKLFKQEYLVRGNLRTPKNKEKLRDLLKNVMIRNTRSAIDLKLPKRFATTMRLEPTEIERTVYAWLKDYLRRNHFKKQTTNLFLREAGSSPFALSKSLSKVQKNGEIAEIIDLIGSLEDISKGKALVDLVKKNPEERKIIFAQYLNSLDFITDLLRRYGVDHVTFKGGMSTKEKNNAIASFKNEVPLLVSTELGGEGSNLQFCRTIINFDLPWNPMRIEQRIGRLHRIGQTRDVFVFNLSVRETIEDYMIEILDSKINMFEMVIGEIEPIMGHISEDKDFDDVILDIWLRSGSDKELEDRFEALGNEMITAKKNYLKAKAFDEEIFGEDYEI